MTERCNLKVLVNIYINKLYVFIFFLKLSFCLTIFGLANYKRSNISMIFIVYTVFTILFFGYCFYRKKCLERELNARLQNINILRLKSLVSSGIIILITILLAYPDLFKFTLLSFKFQGLGLDSITEGGIEYRLIDLFNKPKGLIISTSLVILIYLVNLIEKMIHGEHDFLRATHVFISFISFLIAIFLFSLAFYNYKLSSYFFGYELIFIIFVVLLTVQQYKFLLHHRILVNKNVIQVTEISKPILKPLDIDQ